LCIFQVSFAQDTRNRKFENPPDFDNTHNLFYIALLVKALQSEAKGLRKPKVSKLFKSNVLEYVYSDLKRGGGALNVT
jgi:hypothetical protein